MNYYVSCYHPQVGLKIYLLYPERFPFLIFKLFFRFSFMDLIWFHGFCFKFTFRRAFTVTFFDADTFSWFRIREDL